MRAVLTLQQLRELAERLPDGAALTLPKAVLLEALGAATHVGAANSIPAGEFTVADVAARFQRSRSTIRGWLEAGRFEGAYKLNGRDWRVPSGAVEAFVAAQQARHAGRTDGVGAWRRYR